MRVTSAVAVSHAYLVDEPPEQGADVVRERHVGEAGGQQRQQRRAAVQRLLAHVHPDVVLRPQQCQHYDNYIRLHLEM